MLEETMQQHLAGEPVAQMPDNWRGGLNEKQRRSLELLGQGISPVMVASTLGVSESLISQYISDPRFSEEVTKIKLKTLQAQTDIDHKYMAAELKLVDKLLKVIPLMTKPMEILKGLQTVNATKRRGMADVATAGAVTNIVNINLPQVMASRFITGANNQIVEIQDEHGPRSLVTATSEAVGRYANETHRESEAIADASWQETPSASDLLRAASKRIQESSATEVTGERLRARIEAKREITEHDL